MDLISFTKDYTDLSTERGYQFKFFCDKCRNGYMSPFVQSKLGTTTSILRTVGSIFGGVLGRVGEGSYEIQRAIGGKEHDAAFREATVEAKKKFRQCTRCGQWVCAEACWNKSRGLCESCAPDVQEEVVAADVERERLETTLHPSKSGKNKALVVCPSCGIKIEGGKFCTSCGTNFQAIPKCKKCGAAIKGNPKFCSECGTQT